MIAGTWFKGKWVRLLSDALTGLLMFAAIVVIGLAVYRRFGVNAVPVTTDRKLREGELAALEPSMLRPVRSGALVVVVFSDYQSQPGCISKYGYWNGSGVTCTTQAGINCITCPK